nr:carbon storage regulator CsrA [Desulforadius tongensis]
MVLSRKKGQAINIGHHIKIVVVDVQKDHIRIGIEAPRDVDVYRGEIYTAIQKENLNAIAKGEVFKLIRDKPTPGEKDGKNF